MYLCIARKEEAPKWAFFSVQKSGFTVAQVVKTVAQVVKTVAQVVVAVARPVLFIRCDRFEVLTHR